MAMSRNDILRELAEVKALLAIARKRNEAMASALETDAMRPPGSLAERDLDPFLGGEASDIDEAARRYSDGEASLTSLAREFGLSVEKMNQALARGGVNVSRHPNDIDQKEMRRRFEAGESLARIGRELGFSRSVVELQLALQGLDVQGAEQVDDGENEGADEHGDARAVRRWALGAGYDVATRGRIPSDVREAYEAAHLGA